MQQPLDGLDTDYCLTADGELVLLHDPLLDLGTTVSGWAHQRRAAEIRAGRLRHRDARPSKRFWGLVDINGRAKSTVEHELALRPGFPAQARTPPTARPASRGERRGLPVLTAAPAPCCIGVMPPPGGRVPI
jgi:hypothetical protein